MKLFFAALFMLVSFSLQAQSLEGDLNLIFQSRVEQEQKTIKNKRTWNPLLLSYRLGIKLYQNHISPQLATSCAFELTCSRFSKAMVNEYGLMKGYFLTFDRLARCNKITSMETYPIRLNKDGKIIESPADFHFH